MIVLLSIINGNLSFKEVYWYPNSLDTVDFHMGEKLLWKSMGSNPLFCYPSSKYLILFSAEERNPCSFGTAWGLENYRI